jgi:hypothetical protein
MDINDLKKRFEELLVLRQSSQAILNQTVVELNRIDGAMQEIQYWVKKLEGSK